MGARAAGPPGEEGTGRGDPESLLPRHFCLGCTSPMQLIAPGLFIIFIFIVFIPIFIPIIIIINFFHSASASCISPGPNCARLGVLQVGPGGKRNSPPTPRLPSPPGTLGCGCLCSPPCCQKCNPREEPSRPLAPGFGAQFSLPAPA